MGLWAYGGEGGELGEDLAQTRQKKGHMDNTPYACTYGYEVVGAQHELYKTEGRDG